MYKCAQRAAGGVKPAGSSLRPVYIISAFVPKITLSYKNRQHINKAWFCWVYLKKEWFVIIRTSPGARLLAIAFRKRKVKRAHLLQILYFINWQRFDPTRTYRLTDSPVLRKTSIKRSLVPFAIQYLNQPEPSPNWNPNPYFWCSVSMVSCSVIHSFIYVFFNMYITNCVCKSKSICMYTNVSYHRMCT